VWGYDSKLELFDDNCKVVISMTIKADMATISGMAEAISAFIARSRKDKKIRNGIKFISVILMLNIVCVDIDLTTF